MSNAQKLIEEGDQLFSKRLSLMSFFQEVADNFYVERADFTVSRNLGDEFADHLTTSFPIIARRDLGNAFSGMLRPRDTEWFFMSLMRDDKEDNAAKRWLQAKTRVQRRAMYERGANFTRATKEGDHDYATFGQCAISTELNRAGTSLLYRNWHLRDVAWRENAEGKIDEIHRRWRPTVLDLARMFGDEKLHPSAKETLQKEPYTLIQVRHVVMPSDAYDLLGDAKRRNTKFVSIYVDVDNQHIIEESGAHNPIYTIPRWQTVSGSQYAYSPAVVAALPDARLIQAMTLSLLEAGEKSTNPPMVATQEVVRSDVQLFSGGITWVDAEYDERLGEVLRPISQDFTGAALGGELAREIRNMIAEAFFLNKLTLPPSDRDMTAFEVSQRIQEFIRNALPLFEPMELDYNGELCEITADVLLRNGAFGPIDEMPQSIRGQDFQFKFESPLHQAIERQKGQHFLEAKQMLREAAELAPSSVMMFDARTALRSALEGIGTPAAWMRSKDQVDELLAEEAAEQEQQQALAQLQQGAEVAKTAGEAQQALAPAEAA